MEPGTLGAPLKLITNNFAVQVPQGRIFQYSVDIVVRNLASIILVVQISACCMAIELDLL